MKTRVHLIVDRDGDRIVLRSPGVGWFSQALPKGQVLAPDARAGVLETLGNFSELVVPAGVLGRIASEAPERFNEPVEYGQVLYELDAFEGSLEEVEDEQVALEGGLALRAPFAGRFWHRPSPGDPAFVEAGSELTTGRTVGLLEVMKTFSHVHYEGPGLPERGKVVRVVPGDGDEVAAGDPLLVVEPL